MERLRLKEFWEKKADYYPLPFDEGPFTETKRVLQMVKSHGVSFSGKTVLDIGCGTGTYALPIAMEASFVLGIDCSERMLSILTREAEKRQLRNVATLNIFFDELDLSNPGIRGGFDIVMAMMTPAVTSKRHILMMEEASREWCIYMGWGKKRKNPALEEVLSLHGVETATSSGAFNVCMILEALGRRFHFQFFETAWSFRGSIVDAANDLSLHVQLSGREPKRELILHVLRRHEREGIVEHVTEAEIGLVLWRKHG